MQTSAIIYLLLTFQFFVCSLSFSVYSPSHLDHGFVGTMVVLRWIGKNIRQQYCWCSLMWLMPLRSLSNCDYELYFYLRLILGPIHSNQVMGTDPVGSYHGTRNSRSNSINPTYPYQSHDLKTPPRHTHVPPVQNNQPGTGFGSRGKSVGLGPSVTPLGWLSAPRINARGAIWAHIQILLSRNS